MLVKLKDQSQLWDDHFFCREFDEMLRIRREVDKKIKEMNSAVQVNFTGSSLVNPLTPMI